MVPEGYHSVPSGEQLKAFLQEYKAHCVEIYSDGRTQMSLDIDGTLTSSKFTKIIPKSKKNFQKVKDAKVRDLQIQGSSTVLQNVNALSAEIALGNEAVRLQNCEIGFLRLVGGESHPECTVEIINCSLAFIWVSASMQVRDLVVENSVFSRFDLRKIEDRAPEHIRIKHTPVLSMRDTFSRMYGLAVNAGNSHTAHVIRSEELAQEQRTARNSYKALLFLWGLFADYGGAPFRPLVWALGATVLLFVFFMLTGTSVAGDEQLGWRQLLVESEGRKDEILRAIIGCLESGFSPLSAFSYRQLIVPDSLLGGFFKAAISYFSLAMVLLSGFSLRRRFRSFQ